MSTATAIKRESIKPANQDEWLRLRARDITSTEVAALFGFSPYVTPFELWHRKKESQVVEIEPNERMKWGTRLQNAIAAGIAEDQKWAVCPRLEYERLPDLRLGASFDFTIVGKGSEPFGLLEVKNVDALIAREGWIVEDDELEAPPHIELQVQHQLLVSGLSYAYIGALIGGNRTVLIRRQADQDVFDSILNRAEDFWKSVDQGMEPKPDFKKDAAFIVKLYQSVKPGKVVDVSEDKEIAELVAEFKHAKDVRDEAEKAREAVKAQLMVRIGDAEKAIGKGWSISASTIKATHVAYDRASYRDFRVNFKKSKES